MNNQKNRSQRMLSRHDVIRIIIPLAIGAMILCSLGLAAGDRNAVVDGNNQFAFSLYKQLESSNAGRNIFVSPAGISAALAMTYSGARGETEKQMARVLHFSLPQQQLHPAFSEILSGLKGTKDYEMAVANRLWGQKNYKFSDDFLKTTKMYYQGGFQDVDFVSDPESSCKTINAWVEEKTRQKIKDLLQTKDITSLTRLVLTNAIYFKGSWVARFNQKNTADAPFLLEDGKTIKTPMMSQTGKFNCLEEGSFDMLELPYAGDRLSMLVMLPGKGSSLAKMEKLLTPENLRQWRSSMHEGKVTVALPRFKTTTRFVLNDQLVAMGMKDAFDEKKADFSGMTGRPNLYISKAIHKAFVDVNEEGTEAAAATAIVINTKNGQRTIVFSADHPFLFMIFDKESESILFLGRLMNPAMPE
jgi:serpin B